MNTPGGHPGGSYKDALFPRRTIRTSHPSRIETPTQRAGVDAHRRRDDLGRTNGVGTPSRVNGGR